MTTADTGQPIPSRLLIAAMNKTDVCYRVGADKRSPDVTMPYPVKVTLQLARIGTRALCGAIRRRNFRRRRKNLLWRRRSGPGNLRI
jgi:hypothetical protein